MEKTMEKYSKVVCSNEGKLKGRSGDARSDKYSKYSSLLK